MATGFDPNLPPEIDAQQQSIAHQQAIAEAMLQRSMAPLQGSHLHWSQALAQVLNARQGRADIEGANKARTDLAQRYQSGLADEVQRIAGIRHGKTINPDPQEVQQSNDQGTPEPRPTSTGNPRDAIQAALLSQYAPVRQMGVLEHKTYEHEQTRAADRESRSFDRLMALEAAAQNQALSREDRAARAEEAAALRRELAGQADRTRRDLAAQKNTPKLPTPALKLQQEELDAIGTASSINADLGGIAKQIEAGKLDLSLMSNVTGAVRNYVGASDENSRNLASFKSTLEKLRNDSLRLNKGVQTEGDAQRAWNELVSNINDKGVVKQRLAEIQKINERAVNLRKMNVDSIRGNFGLEPMDTAGYEQQPAAVGARGPAVGAVRPAARASAAPKAGAVMRFDAQGNEIK